MRCKNIEEHDPVPGEVCGGCVAEMQMAPMFGFAPPPSVPVMRSVTLRPTGISSTAAAGAARVLPNPDMVQDFLEFVEGMRAVYGYSMSTQGASGPTGPS